MSEPRVTPPPGAWASDRTPTQPTAAHAGVVVFCLAISAVLVLGSGAIGGGGLLTLLVLLLGGFALVVPVALVAGLWRQAGAAVRTLIALALAACAVLLVLAVVRVVAVVPPLLAA
ncbi:hypothetical protein [Pseudonocardia sp. MH-G8]|uniref:hypothetical protein n=1 Tax=Pseudonocardia sp. MH-G8 TaxID=1854588 RepID=UPI001179BD60|nr:hypothetical protein [Pseudonocardia sp. MH-G8]